MRVTAVIPTWNRADLVRSVIRNLQAQIQPPNRILVVDNGSTDSTREVTDELGADYLRLDKNRGFAVAVNAGIGAAESEWVLILNNDVILRPDWIRNIVTALGETSAWFAVGKLLQSGTEDRLDGSWDLVSRAGYAWRCGYERPDGRVWSERRRIALAPMTAVMFHRDVFTKVGLLETRFESYYEDVDFGIRCALAGIGGVYEPSAVAVHLGKATYGKRAKRVYFLSTRNQLLLIAKHYPGRILRRWWWEVLAGQTLALLAAAKQGHLLAGIRGKWQALRLWRSFRKSLPDSAAVEAVMDASEREIYALQSAIGFDSYWRLYFALVRSR
ncbi:MAG TPA: glycosyltransferase family 2 protein [Bryobacteraceae bacterium]|nr:glycosyltransferase family 2 protein [Bryobacteraceae bacterium]